MQDLIERLEKATGPDRELDSDIASLVYPNGEGAMRYTSSIDAARSIDKGALCVFASDIGADGQAIVKLVTDTATSPIIEHTGIHSRLEIAWCIAAVKGRAAQ
jgi:hypothetical protein